MGFITHLELSCLNLPLFHVQRFSVVVTARFLGFTSELEQLLLKEVFRLPASLRVPFTGWKEWMSTARTRQGFPRQQRNTPFLQQDVSANTDFRGSQETPPLPVWKQGCRLNQEPQRNLHSPMDWKMQMWLLWQLSRVGAVVCLLGMVRKHGILCSPLWDFPLKVLLPLKEEPPLSDSEEKAWWKTTFRSDTWWRCMRGVELLSSVPPSSWPLSCLWKWEWQKGDFSCFFF